MFEGRGSTRWSQFPKADSSKGDEVGRLVKLRDVADQSRNKVRQKAAEQAGLSQRVAGVGDR